MLLLLRVLICLVAHGKVMQKGARTLSASVLMPDKEIVYTVEEVAKLLKADVRTIRRMIYNGEITAFRVGKNYRIHKSTLDGLMRINQKENQGD